jgi:diguanylate cyclase (GGDEF)-like protein/hemerythrin-like metal-binding protein
MIGTHSDVTERKQVERALEESNRKLETLSMTDGLTGIANRRHFDEILFQEHGRHARSGAELSLIMLDIDYFKMFNDCYGHVAGDDCLRQIARIMSDSVARTADLVARYGGEEFVCVLPETDLAGARAIAEKIRTGILARAIPHKGSRVSEYVTASLGVISVRCTYDKGIEDLLAQVDGLLYRAKSNGRNRVEFNETQLTAEQSHINLVQLVWKDAFNCGNKLIDMQHQSLFHISNELLEAVLANTPITVTSSIVRRLLHAVTQHFCDEEKILETAGYTDLKRHAEEHATLNARGQELSRELEASTLSTGDVFQFLVHDVVMEHLLGTDRKYFPFITNS